uniref:Uncharacterized protein n=1 Tax=Odontella aurita TaxID=265563 RepID=A0A7S4MPI6_9STRA|mmetsp:Transcript_27533/g.80984  ORF Transcript_27533/g.80984 Transcript_27533/m.80984 type:complete len:112 (+) Transcript_27533:377-712(+)
MQRTPLETDQIEEVRSCADKESSDDFDQAQGAIFHAIEDAEKAVLHAVEDEVDTFFHGFPPKQQKEDSTNTAGNRKGQSGSTADVQTASFNIGWKDRLLEAQEDCLEGMLE